MVPPTAIYEENDLSVSPGKGPGDGRTSVATGVGESESHLQVQSTDSVRDRLYRKDTPATVACEFEGLGDRTAAEALRDKSQALARQARDSFRNACEASDETRAETNYLAVKDLVEELWSTAEVRDNPFRDLLASLEAATKYTDISAFNHTQRDVLRNAFDDLTRWGLGYDLVDEHLEKFAEFDINVTGPIAGATPKKLKITIEEIG